VKHAGKSNALSGAFGHHVAEGRWIHDARLLDGGIHFRLREARTAGEFAPVRENIGCPEGVMKSRGRSSWKRAGFGHVRSYYGGAAESSVCNSLYWRRLPMEWARLAVRDLDHFECARECFEWRSAGCACLAAKAK